MGDPAVAALVDAFFGAEGARVFLTFSALIDKAALVTAKGFLILIILEQVLADFRADLLHQETDMSQHGIVAQHRVGCLAHVMQTQKSQRCKQHEGKDKPVRSAEDPNPAEQGEENDPCECSVAGQGR
jgi:hypothetical protein